MLQDYRAVDYNFVHVTRDKVPHLVAAAKPFEEAVDTTPIDFVVTNYSMIDSVARSAVESMFISVPSLADAHLFRRLLTRVNSYIACDYVPRFCIFVPVRLGDDPRKEVCRYFTKDLESSVHIICCPETLLK